MGSGLRLFQRFAEELADEADRPERDRQRPGQRAGSEDSHEQQRPHERVDGARRNEDQLRQQVERCEPDEIVRGEYMPTGSASTNASSVPSEAMWIVSISAANAPVS